MSLLTALITYGVTNGVLEGASVDSFVDFMPESPDTATTFTEYAGDAASQFTPVVHRSVQVKTRGATAEVARQRAVQLFEIFHTANEARRIDFTPELWGQVYVRQPPFKLSQDKSDRVTYCFNLGITTNILE